MTVDYENVLDGASTKKEEGKEVTQDKGKTFWITVQKRIGSLKFHPKNPRVYTVEDIEKIRKDIEEFGLVEEFVANLDNVLIAGHRRATMYLDDKKDDEMVDVRMPNRLLTPEEHERLMIKLNKISEHHWDYEVLLNNFDEEFLKDEGFGEKELTGFLEEETKVEPEKKEKEKKTKTINVSCPDCSKIFEVEVEL